MGLLKPEEQVAIGGKQGSGGKKGMEGRSKMLLTGRQEGEGNRREE